MVNVGKYMPHATCAAACLIVVMTLASVPLTRSKISEIALTRLFQTQHDRVQSHCTLMWDRKMQKHSDLMEIRRATLAADTGRFNERTVYDPFEPTYTCHSEYRRGKDIGDGGKFVCGEADYFQSLSKQKRCLVYAVGSNGDIAFEQDIIRKFGCAVHTFDPTGNSAEFSRIADAAGATFHAIGVDGSSSTMNNSVTGNLTRLMPIQDIVKLLGHAGREINILKIDCEGCEYAAFQAVWDVIQQGSIVIGQIQVEMHWLDFAKVAAFFDKADKAGYMVFHKERNQWGCDGYICVEFSLIHKDAALDVYKYTHCRQ